jgi:hypothetical protein
MANMNTAMINFRLNLSKKEDKEIYDYIQQFDSREFKTVLKGGKSNFIKTVLLSYIRGIKQEQKAAKTLAEQKAQNEELEEKLGAKLEECRKTLLQALPDLVEKVVIETLESKMVVSDDLAAVLQAAVASCVSDTTSGAETAESVKAVTAVADDLESTRVLPQVSDKLPDEALDYFLGL